MKSEFSKVPHGIFYVVSQAVVSHSRISVQKQMIIECYQSPLLSDSILGSVQILRSHLSFPSNHDSDDSKISFWDHGSFWLQSEEPIQTPLHSCFLTDRDDSSAPNEEPEAQRENCKASWYTIEYPWDILWFYDGAEREHQLGFGVVIDLWEISLWPFWRDRQ